MKSHYSILHISDLHKGENNDFNNLLASLCNDVDSYEQYIPKPEIIVVSGDLAEGANGEGAEQKIIEQYNEVESFLNGLVSCFLDGDKRRIIIVPGNHDLFRGATIESMTIIPDEVREAAKKQFLNRNPDYRWSWNDFSFYIIENKDIYASRFRLFVDFYNRFYGGIRKIIDCDILNDVIDFPDYNISFALFNSCFGIDHLNQSGAISPTAISGAQSDLSKMYKFGRFIIGVWHHNISGMPTQMNYLDPRILHSLTDFHIQVGLYGHQHHAEVLHEYRDVFKQGRMTLISSGCLYGRGKTMPEGTHCQYNIIEISQDHQDRKVTLTLHVREDETGWEIPSWRKKQIDGKDFFQMKFDLPEPNYDRLIQHYVDIAKVEGCYAEAIYYLTEIRDKNKSADKFIDEFLKTLTNEQIIKLAIVPRTDVQVISVLGAYNEAHNWVEFDKVVKLARDLGLTSPMINVIVEDAQKKR